MVIRNLWPEDIQLDVLPPLFILRSQATAIKERTDGVLTAAVTTVTGDKDFVIHRLDLIPTQLDGSRHRVLSATHRQSFYPVVVEADVFLPNPETVNVVRPREVQTTHDQSRWPHPDDWRPVASSQDEFIDRVREVLRSPQVRALIESLLARSYEKTLKSTDDGPNLGDHEPG